MLRLRLGSKAFGIRRSNSTITITVTSNVSTHLRAVAERRDNLLYSNAPIAVAVEQVVQLRTPAASRGTEMHIRHMHLLKFVNDSTDTDTDTDMADQLRRFTPNTQHTKHARTCSIASRLNTHGVPASEWDAEGSAQPATTQCRIQKTPKNRENHKKNLGKTSHKTSCDTVTQLVLFFAGEKYF